MKPEAQNIHNHRQLVPLYHFTLLPLGAILIVASAIHMIASLADGENVLPAVLMFLLSAFGSLTVYLAREMALKAQDRAIRAEENFRHYVLAGSRLDPRLNIYQIIALRFAGDGEFPGLCAKAAEQRMSPNEIKRAIREWRPDTHRA